MTFNLDDKELSLETLSSDKDDNDSSLSSDQDINWFFHIGGD